MGNRIREWFGFDIDDWSAAAVAGREGRLCPFLGGAKCQKNFNDKSTNGVCAVSSVTGDPVAVCPKRLYAEDYAVLRDVAAKGVGSRVNSSRFRIHPRGDHEISQG